MDRVQHASAAPGNLFTEGDPGTGTPATTVTDVWLNHLQEELALLVEYAGITLDDLDDEQVRKAFETLFSSGRAGTTTNVVDAYTLATTPTPSFDVLIAGMIFAITFNSTNAGAATLDINGTGVNAIVTPAGAALAGGEIVASGTSMVMYDGTSYRLLNPAILGFSKTDITGQPDATIAADDKLIFTDTNDSDDLKQSTVQDIIDLIPSGGFSQVIKQVFTVGGTYTPTAGMQYITYKIVGGGGATRNSTSGTVVGGAGAGSYSEGVLTAAQIGVSKVITIGAGGVSSSTVGGNGGNSSIGSLATTNGGIGNSSSTSYPVGALGGAVGTGDVVIKGGQGSDGGIDFIYFGGDGADSQLGQGGTAGTAGSVVARNGREGSGYGAAASGAINGGTGVNGQPGIIIITEYI